MTRTSWFKILVVATATSAISGCMKLDFMFFPGVELEAYELPDNHIPEGQLEQVSLESSDGNTIEGIWARVDGEATATFLYSHGNGQNIDHYWDRVQLLWDEGYDVFIYDYPGYGMSSGDPSEDSVYAAAIAAHDHVIERTASSDGDTAVSLGVAYYGWSLGTAPTTYLAAEIEEPAALFLESPMACSQALVEDSMNMSMPAGYVIEMELDNVGRIAEIDAPKVLMHGIVDDYIGVYNSELLYDAADLPLFSWYPPTADHGNVVCDGETESCVGASDESHETWRNLVNGVVAEFVNP